MEEKRNLHKKNNTIIRNTLKNNIFILLVITTVMYSVCARISDKGASLLIDKIKIENNIILHPDGRLSPTIQYMACESGFMENFRMYWHGIYSEEAGIENIYVSTEDSKNLIVWKVHDIIHKDHKKNRYLSMFAQQLINLFPSENGVYSIESNNLDSFTQFLRKHKDKRDSLNLLAVLFLLAEGIYVPIEIEYVKGSYKSKRIILKNYRGHENAFYINLSLNIIDESENNGEKINPWTSEGLYYHKAESIIEFFKGLIIKSSHDINIPEEFSMPTTYEEFLTGNFLCSPGFLIQSYIFEYIDSVEMYEKFVIAVYEMLNIYKITNYDAPISNYNRRIMELLNRLFAISNVLDLDAQLAMRDKRRNFPDFCKFKSVKDECKNTPFIDVIYKPSYVDGPAYVDNNLQHTLSYKSIRCFKNCQNSVLLALFLCFAFDPKTKEYNIDHIPDASKELKEFFSKYTHKVSSISTTMRSDWERVVYGLPKPERGFSTDDSTVNTGLLHMLYTMYDLVGKKHGIIEATKYIKDKLWEDYNTNRREVKENMRECLKEVFWALSRNKALGMICDYLEPVATTMHGHPVTDADMQISLLYDFDSRWYGIKFTVSTSYNNPLVEVIEKEKVYIDETYFYESTDSYDRYDSNSSCQDDYCSHKEDRRAARREPNPKDTIYMDPKTYPQMIIKQFTSKKYLVESAGTSYETNQTFIIKTSYEANKREIVNSNCDNPNRLMLWGSLDDLEYKSHLIKMFLIHSNREALSIDNPMVRFTSNLIRNVPMDDLKARQYILSACVYNSNYRTYYPQLNEYDVYTIPKEEISSNGLSPLMELLLNIEAIHNPPLVDSYICLLHAYKNDSQIPYLFSSLPVIIGILNEIRNDMSTITHKHTIEEIDLYDYDYDDDDLDDDDLDDDDDDIEENTIIDPKKLESHIKHVFDLIHKELMDAMPSPADDNITAIYVCWMYNIINSNYYPGLVSINSHNQDQITNIKHIYMRINQNALSNKIKDILGYKLSNENINKFINFLVNNKSELIDKTMPGSKKKYQAIIDIFNTYITK
ncbi:hypothetical protein NEIRO02_2179 [Nematocida sp. AWRm79]|nr:hypothetical protein NEIRO02_2179 [Nematocida sp. AWRm79]